MVRLSFDAWPEGRVTPSMHTIEIVAPKPGPKLEAVSTRLKRTLMHPNKTSTLVSLRYSPDGKRILAGDYPGGVIQVWDAESGRQLTRIDAGPSPGRASDYLRVTPDWKSVFVWRTTQKRSQLFEKDGKRRIREDFEADVRAWSLETGALERQFQDTPTCYLLSLTLSPDGAFFLTGENQPGEVTGIPLLTATLWDAKTGQRRRLPDGSQVRGAFSPDSTRLAVATNFRDRKANGIRVFDVPTLQEKLFIPVTEPNGYTSTLAFASDGKTLVGDVRVLPQSGSVKAWLVCWDVASGRPLASFPSDPGTYFVSSQFSPDGSALASWNDQGKLFLFDVPGLKLVKAIVLPQQKAVGERVSHYAPVFSPDGKWLAMTTQIFLERRSGEALSAEDVAQPRIHLIDVVAGELQETLVAPKGIAGAACFSPDGKTLATAGHGHVLLWDLTLAPIGSDVRRE